MMSLMFFLSTFKIKMFIVTPAAQDWCEILWLKDSSTEIVNIKNNMIIEEEETRNKTRQEIFAH